MQEKHIYLRLIVQGIIVRVTKHNGVDSFLSCPCQKFFTLLIDHINKILDIMFIVLFDLDKFFRGDFVGLAELGVHVVILLLFEG